MSGAWVNTEIFPGAMTCVNVVFVCWHPICQYSLAFCNGLQGSAGCVTEMHLSRFC